MTSLLRSGMRRLVGAMVLAGTATTVASAQSPVAASCTPGAASNANASLFRLGISNVTLGSINNTTAGYADGYQDYSATQQTALVVGRSYTLSVTAGGAGTAAGGGENTGAWIDYNNNGSFNDPGELVMAVAPAPAGAPTNSRVHLATFTVPASAVTGGPLRLRINSDLVSVALPTACSTPQYSQCEDYAVTLGTNSSPPAAAFTVSTATTCDGCVQFTDASQNVPTAWSWNFGDGSPAATTQNPRYCYTRPGTYNVTLTATNAAGTNPSAATAITYNTRIPRAATCTPNATTPLGANGIVRFRLGRIDNPSAGAAAGYQDFSCTRRDSILVGRPYPITVDLASPATANQDTKVYLDLNDNGSFETNELLLSFLSTGAPTGTLSLPAATVVNRPLRLRVVSDGGGTNPTACTLQSGQAEDYTLIALPDTAPPTVSFTSDFVPGNCINPVQFTNQVTGNPTTYLWRFGDGLTSANANPSHQYALTGTYTVTLTATNANGTATFTRTDYISIQVPCFIYCGANGAGGQGGPPQPSPFWLDTFGMTAAAQSTGGPTFAPFSYQTPPGGGNPTNPTNATGGYGNYTNQVITLRAGQQHTATAISSFNFAHRTVAWIDYDRDGVFDNSSTSEERVVNFQGPGQTHAVPFVVPATVNGVSTTGQTRLRVIVAANQNQPTPCGRNLANAEVEDYTVTIMPLLSVRAAYALPALTVYPNPTPDGRLALTLADAAAAGDYAATVQNVLGATLLRTTLRLTPAAPAALDLHALAPGVYVLRLVDAHGRTALRRVVRE